MKNEYPKLMEVSDDNFKSSYIRVVIAHNQNVYIAWMGAKTFEEAENETEVSVWKSARDIDPYRELKEAYEQGKVIQANMGSRWEDIKGEPVWNDDVKHLRIKPEELKYKVGDKVITKGYFDDYDGKVLTINQIDYDMYCYFDEANNKTDNFLIIQIERFATEEEIRAASIDWSVVNDTDWFYGKMKNGIIGDYLIRGLKDEDGRISFNEMYYIENGKHYKNDKFSFVKLETEKFRLATEQEKQMVFKKYPGLKPVEVGDYGVFWDDKSNHLIGYLGGVQADSTFPYRIIGGFNYKHFRRINPHKGTLAEQAPELFDKLNQH